MADGLLRRILCRKGTILLRLRRRPEAATVFIKSIGGYACNWSAYVGLTACVSSSDELETILSVLPPHPFTTCFEIHARLDFHIEAKDVGELVDELERSVFSIGLTERGRREGRTWIWGASRKALIDYHVRGASSAPQRGRPRGSELIHALPFQKTLERQRPRLTPSRGSTRIGSTTSTTTRTCSSSSLNSQSSPSSPRSTATSTATGPRRAR